MREENLEYEKIAEYRSKGNKYCLVLPGREIRTASYQINMIRYNQVGNLLPTQFMIEDGHYQYYYDISRTISLGNELKHGSMQWNQMIQLLTNLYKTVSRMEDFLLELDSIILQPDYIFKNLEAGDYYFCYYPDKKDGFEQSLGDLLEILLNKLDYGDERGVQRAYELYQNVRKDHMPLAQIIKKYSMLPESEEMQEEVYYQNSNHIWKDMEQSEEKQKKEDKQNQKKRADGIIEEFAENEEIAKETDGTGLKRMVSIIPYLPDLIAAIVVAGMAYYLISHHDAMSGNHFMLWCGGILLVVVISASCSTFFSKKQEDKEASAEVGMENHAARRSIITEKETEHGYQYSFGARKQDHLVKEQMEDYFEEATFAGDGDSGPDDRPLKDHYEIRNKDDAEVYYEVRNKDDAGVYCEIPRSRSIENLSEIPRTRLAGDHSIIPKTVVMKSADSVRETWPVLKSKDQEVCQDIVLNQGKLVIGKLEGFVDVCLSSQCISRVHAQLMKENDVCSIMDLGSTNGCFVNGIRLAQQEKVGLHPGDQLSLADLKFEFLWDFQE